MGESRNLEAREDLETIDDAVFGIAGFHLVEDPLLAVAVEQGVLVTEAIFSFLGATVS